MKEIKAYIKAHKLEAVTLALHRVPGLTGMSVNEVRGFGRSREGRQRSLAEQVSEFVRHVKIEVVCHDELAEQVIEAIRQNAHTGLRADGKIYLSEVQDAVRIETGERGRNAV